ncbi:hypothetical protein E1281_19060 [Actinomadura sp. KC345]|uniref:hypothetical protein n=1 Tax=Actinomadura sp. KC345 TaxID=2530371 RepID=UPI00104E1678|nr:hypothetical protein [Actinomadura sp. KC345]TDC52496.1 hypothetical protein E1281_19060 [Actinomadura sp. KC345]
MSTPTAAPDQIAETVIKLNAGWYNVVAQALNLDTSTFLLAQGTLGLQSNDSSGLYLMSDAVIPSASVAYLDPTGLSKRSSAYRMLLGALRSEGGTDLPAVLGDQYSRWLDYRDNWWKQNPTSTLTQATLFEQWADRMLNPGQKASAIAVFKQQANTPLIRALDALSAPAATQEFVRQDGERYRLFVYSANIEAARQGLNTGGQATIDFNSESMESRLQHTTVMGSASGFYDIFSASASGSFDQLNKQASESSLTVKGRIGQYSTLVTHPMDWFQSDEYMRAYNNKGADVWDPQASAGDWDSFFAQPNGQLARRLSQLVLVSDYDLTVTSHATYSQSQVQQITAEASGGVWPFFSASASSSHRTEYHHNDDGTLSVEHKLPKGDVQIWGANYQNAPK